MQQFTDLFRQIDSTTSTNAKVAALAAFFRTASDEDKLWCIALFSGRRPKRAVSSTRLRKWAAEAAGVPLWLLEEAYPVVGDLSETIALILPPSDRQDAQPLSAWMTFVLMLSDMPEEERKAQILSAWGDLDDTQRFVFNKLLTGGFRVGVSQRLMTRALAQATEQDEAAIAHRLMGQWTPQTTTFSDLILSPSVQDDLSRPYPFQLAHGIEGDVADIGPPTDWSAEWKWDGIRGQMILRGGEMHIWSRGEELMTDRFPELRKALDFLPQGTVMDGEILAYKNGTPLPFNDLQKRIGRKTVPASLLKSAPVVMQAYDLLEHDGLDIRERPFTERRALLDGMIQDLPPDAPVILSPQVTFTDWAELATMRETSRDRMAEGLMLKRKDGPYLAGRKRGEWWKWKIDPLTIDAVMIYAQSGHGRRANLFTDFTFAVWNGNELVPFTKAYSGLTDAEFNKITRWVRANTQERFGPVRRVTPELVFEIAFEGIAESKRHKCGVALRFPRMLRWRHDKPAQQANTLADLKALMG